MEIAQKIAIIDSAVANECENCFFFTKFQFFSIAGENLDNSVRIRV